MAKIFISYSRDNLSFIQSLAMDLEAMGDDIWFDQALTGGHAWWEQVLEQARGCDVFLFALSRSSLTSPACKLEYGYAADLGKPILPVLTADDVSLDVLPPALLQIQYVDYRSQNKAAGFALARALRTLPPPKPLPDPLPIPPTAPLSPLAGLAERLEQPALDFREQCSLLVELRVCLRDPTTAAGARTLIDKLRERADLFAAVDREIETFEAGARVFSDSAARPDNVPSKKEPKRRSQSVGNPLVADEPINDDGETALMVAARAGTLDEVRRLVEQGADPARTDRWGETVRQKALRNAQPDIVQFLDARGIGGSSLDPATEQNETRAMILTVGLFIVIPLFLVLLTALVFS